MDFQTRYEFDPKKDLLGKGGFSKVYKATDILLERTVALKFFTAKTADKYQVLNEIKKVIRFEHPNLCKYYDVALLNYKNVLDETEQMEVGIMEYIDAGDFKSYLKKYPEQTDKLLTDVLKGLAYLHKHGMAHRDLKPQNILIKMVDDEPVSKITDFGISKIVDADEGNSSALLGTVEYMAPEQFNPKKYGINGRIGTNLDLWSFGLLVYEAICHHSLFGSRSGGISAEQVMSNILSDAPPEKLEALPPKYKAIIDRCLVKNANQRVQNALELIPLFAVHETTVIAEAKATDSGEVAPTQTLNLPLDEEEEEGLTRNLSLPKENAADLLPESESEVDTEHATEVLMASADGDTVVLEGLEQPTGETQVLEPDSGLLDVTRPIEFVSPTILRAETTEPVAVAEEPTQVINKIIAKPAVKERLASPNVDAARKAIQWQKPANKPLGKIALLAGLAILLLGFFVAYPLLNKAEEKPPLPPDRVAKKAEPSKPPAPSFSALLTKPVLGGTFAMGVAGSDVIPSHPVTLKDFAIGEREVTVDEFRKFVNKTGYKTTAETGGSLVFIEGKWRKKDGVTWQHDGFGNPLNATAGNLPVVHISWLDAKAYCDWLSETTGQPYRLPTEAEWEYAARGGKNSKDYSFSGGDDVSAVGWTKENAGNNLHPPAQLQANELGLYDMSGNVMEWCADWYADDAYQNSLINNPAGPKTPGADRKRVLRGGGWGTKKELATTTYRVKGFAENESGGNVGFRICKSLK